MTRKQAVLVDVVLVALFATIGYLTHHHVFSPAGIAKTALPFLAALVLGWTVMLVRKRPWHTLGAGIYLWVLTVVGGLVLRVGFGETAAWPFVIVTTVTLGLFLVGWRALFGRRLQVAESGSTS